MKGIELLINVDCIWRPVKHHIGFKFGEGRLKIIEADCLASKLLFDFLKLVWYALIELLDLWLFFGKCKKPVDLDLENLRFQFSDFEEVAQRVVEVKAEVDGHNLVRANGLKVVLQFFFGELFFGQIAYSKRVRLNRYAVTIHLSFLIV